jgi:GT2 family glycosyltransferase
LLFLDTVWPRASYRQRGWDVVTPRPVEVIKGACVLLRRSALDAVGPLDERYFMYTEEVDLCYRLAEAGWSLWYVPEAVVTHFGGASSQQMAERMYLELYRSKVQFYRKAGGAKRARLFKQYVAIAYLPRLLLQPQRRVYRQLLRSLRQM